MANINRFYSPSRATYVSQFVPDELPAELMIAGLGKRQQKYDTMAAQLQELGNWKQEALPGYDTDYVKNKKQELEGFITSSLNKDLSSPEYVREYQKFLTGFSSDEGLQKVTNSVNLHNQYLERVKKLKEGNGTQYDQAFVENYLRHYNEYTAEGGKGFTGKTQIADPSILEGVDLNKEMEEYFDQLKANGSESIKFLEQGLAYKNGWTGINGQRIDDQVSRVFETFYNSRAGQQLQSRFEMEHIPAGTTYEDFYEGLSPEQRMTFDNAKRTYVANQLTNTGMGFTYSQSTTTADQAYRTKAGWDREDLKLYPQNPYVETRGNTLGVNGPSYSEAMSLWKTNTEAIQEHSQAIQGYQNLLGMINGKVQIPRDQLGRPMLDAKTISLIQGIPGAKNFLEGKPLNSEDLQIFSSEVNKKISDHNYVIGGINLQQENMEYHMRESIQSLNPNLKFGTEKISYTEAMEIGTNLKQLPEMESAMNVVNAMIANNDKSWYDSWMVQQKEKIRTDFQNKTITKEEGLRQLEQLNNLNTWAEAEFYTSKVFTTPGVEGALIAQYNQTGSYQPIATAMPMTTSYIQYGLDANGNPIKMGSTNYIDHYMQNLAQTQPNNFAIYIGNERITPGDPRYPDPSTIKFGSANIELVDGKPVFNGVGNYKTIEPVLNENGDPVLDKNGVKQTQEKTGTLNYTFVAEGVTGSSYLNAKANEAYSNIIVDQGYQPGVPVQFQTNLSPTGQSYVKSYINATDPTLSGNVKTMETMTANDTEAFIRPMYSIYTGNVEQVKYVVKRTDTGEYIVKATDEQGRAMFPNASELRFGSSGQVAVWIKDTETLMNAEGSYGTIESYPNP